MALPKRTLLLFSLLTSLALIRSAPAGGDDWPEYRGPTGDGKSPAVNLPLTWSETENVVWKTPIHDRGLSSPIVLGDGVWLTTATEDGKEMFVLCIDRATGKIRLDKRLLHNERPRPLGNPVNTYATPSPVGEPGRVYVHFGSYGTACLDTETFEVLWQRRDLPCDHWRGPGSSPTLFDDLVILTFDGADVQYIAALDKRTGDTRWVTFRSADYGDLQADGRPLANGDMRKSFGTASVVEFQGQLQVVSVASKATYGYDLKTGKEIWRASHTSHSSGARTVFADGLALASCGLDPTEMMAIRLGGHGDVTSTHVAWKTQRGVPSRSSPILLGNELTMVSEQGVASCLDITTQKMIWQERLGGRFSASLVCVEGRIYLFDDAGVTHVIQPGHEFRPLARNQLDGGLMASPAIAGRAFYLRTDRNLYRIEKKS